MGRYSNVLDDLSSPMLARGREVSRTDLEDLLEEVREQGVLAVDRGGFDDWVRRRLRRHLIGGRSEPLQLATPKPRRNDRYPPPAPELRKVHALHGALGLHPSLLTDPLEVGIPAREAVAWVFYDLDPYTTITVYAEQLRVRSADEPALAGRDWRRLAAREVRSWYRPLLDRCGPGGLPPTTEETAQRCSEPYHALRTHLEWERYAATRYRASRSDVPHVSDRQAYLAVGVPEDDIDRWAYRWTLESFRPGEPSLPRTQAWRAEGFVPWDHEEWMAGRPSGNGDDRYQGVRSSESHNVSRWRGPRRLSLTELGRLRKAEFTGWERDPWMVALRVAGCGTVDELLEHADARAEVVGDGTATLDQLVATARLLVQARRRNEPMPVEWAVAAGRAQGRAS